MTDIVGTGVSPAAIDRAQGMVMAMARARSRAASIFEASDAGRRKAVEAREAAEAERVEYLAEHSDRLSEAEATVAAANARIESIKAAVAGAPVALLRLNRKCDILSRVAAYAALPSHSSAEIAAEAIATLRNYDALDPAGDDAPAGLRAAGSKSGADAAVAFAQIASAAALAASQLRLWAGLGPDKEWNSGPGTARNDLYRSENEARRAQANLEHIKNGPAKCDRQVSDATAKAYEAAAKADAAQSALDAAVKALSEAEAELAALLEDDAETVAADNADFTMFKLTVEHEAYGGGGLADLRSDYEPYVWRDDDEDGERVHDNDDDPRTNAVRSALGAIHVFLGGLGAVRCDCVTDDGSNPVTYWLVVGVGRWRPAGVGNDAPAVQFGEYELPLDRLKGTRLTVRCTAEPVLPSNAFAAIALCPRDDGVGYWGGEGTADRLPLVDEGRAQWLRRVAVSPSKLSGAFERLVAANFNVPLYASILDPDAVSSGEERCLVERMFRFAEVSLVAGEGEAGKSTLLHSLLMAVGSMDGPKQFLGQAIAPGLRPLALLTGEEGPEEVGERQVIFRRMWGNVRLHVICGSGPQGLSDGLLKLDALPDAGVLVVDSFTKFSGGNDADAHVTSEFYNPLAEFARRKNWAVIVIHHLAKGAGSLRDRVRGSVEHINAPRIVIGLERLREGRARLSVLKCNFVSGAWLNRDERQIFAFDAETLRLLPIEQRPVDSDDDVRGPIMAALRRLNGKGLSVYRTGGKSLFAQKPEEVAGITRSRLDGELAALIEAGEVEATERGLVVAGKAVAAC